MALLICDTIAVTASALSSIDLKVAREQLKAYILQELLILSFKKFIKVVFPDCLGAWRMK
jgi:hypothetical protein